MNELDDQALAMLSQARRAFSPSAEDEARLMQRTLRAISVEPLTAVGPQHTPRLGRLLVALSIAGLSGTIGFVLGHRVGREEASEIPVAAPVALSAQPPRVLPAQVEPAPASVPVQPARPHVRASSRAAAKPVEPAPIVVDVPAPVVDEFAELRGGSSLELEVRFMKAVERALRDHDAGFALRVLDELDREVPNGSLTEERIAASVMARCRLGMGNRARLIEELTSRYPASPYLQRVQSSCRK